MRAPDRRDLVGLAVTAALGAGAGWQLSTYPVPLYLAVVHGAMTCALLLTMLRQIRGQRGGVIRCPEPGCAFAVTYTGASAGEVRAWQELAAGHPQHYRA